jgi:predicted ATPase
MAILEGIEIKNYRALKSIQLGQVSFDKKPHPLPRLIAVIGANGVGKSTLLDAFGFIGECLANGVQKACDDRSGFERLRSKGSSGPIEFEIRYREETKARPITYSLYIDLDKRGRPIVVYERLRQRRKGQHNGQPHSFLEIQQGKGKVWSGEATEKQEGSASISIHMSDQQILGIATLGTLAEHPRINAFRTFLQGWYLSYFVPEQARGLNTSGPQPHLNRTGNNLSNYLQFICRELGDEKFGTLLLQLSKKIPGLMSIKPEVTVDKRLLLSFTAQGFEEPFYQQDMSDGTLKLLAYMLLMNDPHPAPFVGIDEPENGLYHQLLITLAEEFKNFSLTKHAPQVLITTHSPHFVDALQPSEVWVLGKDSSGFATLTRASDVPHVADLYEQGIPLGSLWFSNHLDPIAP